MRNDIIMLIKDVVSGTNITQESVQVFAEKKSVARTEFYTALATGLTPKFVFEVDSMDYQSANEPQRISYNGKEYAIIRTYEKVDTGTVEITVGVV